MLEMKRVVEVVVVMDLDTDTVETFRKASMKRLSDDQECLRRREQPLQTVSSYLYVYLDKFSYSLHACLTDDV